VFLFLEFDSISYNKNMRENKSPWLVKLKQDRKSIKLNQDLDTDIAIVGAGIAGIATAFFILKHTNKNIVILEKSRLAYGATGHNAGQVVSYFERGFASLVSEFGLELAKEGQQAIEDAWELLDEIYTEASLDINFNRFLGHLGLVSKDQLLIHLHNNLLRKEAGLNIEKIFIAQEFLESELLEQKFEDLYIVKPQEEILAILETKSDKFIASVSYQKGCLNSALFSEEVFIYLMKKYEDRISLYEHTPVIKIVLNDENALLDTEKYLVKAKKVVLCTNGFQNLNILDKDGLEINTKFHHMINGTVGYMSAYLEKMDKPPVAISYFTNKNIDTNEPYFYLTRRVFEADKEENLISVGGPEFENEDSRFYSRKKEFPEEIENTINNFVKKYYNTAPNDKIDFIFTWHGLMGYTKNKVRLIGEEPKNKILLYNLGCNGVGILPSVYGGKRISLLLNNKKLSKSIFDIPQD
jgi:glycine/D-amino acid oxidase-like deaminating enzyme